MTYLSLDLETYSDISLKDCGVYKYVDSPAFEILLFAYAIDDEPVKIVDIASGELIPEAITNALFDKSFIKTAFNAQFERVCLSKYFKSVIDPVSWHCTMVKALTLGIAGNLDSVSKRLGFPTDKQKLFTGKNLIRLFSIPHKVNVDDSQVSLLKAKTRILPPERPAEWRQFKEYCIQDVVVERAIRKKLNGFQILDEELEMWYLDQRINDYGVRLDLHFVKQAIRIDKHYTNALITRYRELGLVNPSSVAELKKWISPKLGYNVKAITKETLPELLKAAKDLPEVKEALQIRQGIAKTSVSKYTKMEEVICSDKRAKGLLQFYGAYRTGRWAGRLIQVQNLPQNKISDLDMAHSIVQSGDYELLEMVYPSTPVILSQLIRTALIPSEGCRFIVSDFSAIEARVIAWLAGEAWRMAVFATHGKIYEASAAQMFRVPIESLGKGSPLRQKGKVAELALGYAGGAGALIQMGALKMGLTEKELSELVKQWRSANTKIVQFWYDVENAAINAVENRTTIELQHGLKFIYQPGMLFIQLPSGRRIAYLKPMIEDHDKFIGKMKLTFEGLDENYNWVKMDTYGGKLVENCLAGDIPTLTQEGWKPLNSVSTHDLLWDGQSWVTHDGLVMKGLHETININGVRLTPEHLILTERGWVNASSCEGLNWNAVQLPNSNKIRGFRWEEILLGHKMRLWKCCKNGGYRVSERQNKIMRMSKIQDYKRSAENSRNVKASCIRCMARNDRPVPSSFTSSLEKLWRQRYYGLRKVGRKFREFLERYGHHVQKRALTRSYKCGWKLLSRELPMGISQNPKSKQKIKQVCGKPVRLHDNCRTFRDKWNRHNYSNLPSRSECSYRTFTRSTGFYEPVYDLMNAGPLKRFTVLSNCGPVIVHNCVQATARDCLRDAMLSVAAAGYKIAFHVHDEIVMDVPIGEGSLEEISAIMGKSLPWAPDLPLRGDGYICEYYRKD